MKYLVRITTQVETSVVVEAADEDAAADLAIEETNFPYLPGWDCNDEYDPYEVSEVKP